MRMFDLEFLDATVALATSDAAALHLGLASYRPDKVRRVHVSVKPPDRFSILFLFFFFVPSIPFLFLFSGYYVSQIFLLPFDFHYSSLQFRFNAYFTRHILILLLTSF
ncbi:hypothetical protein YC2023_016111 [Brassica napus]